MLTLALARHAATQHAFSSGDHQISGCQLEQLESAGGDGTLEAPARRNKKLGEFTVAGYGEWCQ